MKKLSRFKYGILVVVPGLLVCIVCDLIGLCCLGYWKPFWEVEVMFHLGRRFTR